MKTKIVLPIVIVFIAAVFVANGIYGNKIAKEIDIQLKAKIAKNELPVSIVYSEVKVNPLFSKVNIASVSVSDLETNVIFKCKQLDIDIPYDEALRLAESTEFEEIYSLKLDFVEPEFEGSGILVELKDLKIDFDGHLRKADFENLQSQFPDKKQELKFSFSDLKMQLPEGTLKVHPFSDLQDQFTAFDNGSYSMVFNPEEKEIKVKQFTIESPVISYKGNTTFSYAGNGLNDFKPKTAAVKADLLFEPKDFEWEDKKGGKGEFSLAKLSFKTNSQVSFDSKSFPQGEMKLNIERLKINLEDQKKGGSMLNLSINNLDLEKLELNYLMTDKKLSITNSQIKSSLIDATVFADVAMDSSNPTNSEINKAQVKVSSLSPDLEKMLNGFEQQMGKELPREDGVIVLDLSGKLARPTIKGFEF